MSLNNGIYIITNKADNRCVGRYPVEDLSLLPKYIFALPQGIEPPKWVVMKSGDGMYKLRAMNALAGVGRNGKVAAFLLEEMATEPFDWVITAQPQHGNDVYTIEKKGRSAGWVVGNNDQDNRGQSISVQPLIMTESIPPQFPDTHLFTFMRLDRD